jgi:hypothetical protein
VSRTVIYARLCSKVQDFQKGLFWTLQRTSASSLYRSPLSLADSQVRGSGPTVVEQNETSTAILSTAVDNASELVHHLVGRITCSPGRFWATVVTIAFIYSTLALGQALTKHPWMDEGWLASPAHTLITKGYMGSPVQESLGTKDRYFYYNPPLFILAQAAWYKAFGFSLLALRTLSMVWGLVAMASWFFIMMALSGNRSLALFTFALVGLDVIFVRDASFGRMDMMSAALGFAGYAAYLLLRERNLTTAILTSQSLVMLSGLTHPNGRLEFVGLLYLTLAFDMKRLQWRHLALGTVPYLIGAIAWGAYILKDPSLFYLQFRENIGERWRGFSHPLNSIMYEITHRYLAAYGFGPQQVGTRHVMIVFLIVYLLGVAMAFGTRELRRHVGYRKLLVLLAIPAVILSFSVDYNPVEYMVNIVPVFAAILAVSVHWIWIRRPQWAAMIASGVSVFLLLNIGALTYRIVTDDYHNSYLPAVQFVQQNSNPTMLIMGNANLAFGLGFPKNFLDDKELGFRSGKRADMIVVDDEWKLIFQMLKDRGRLELYNYIMNTLQNDYRAIYHHGVYEIYIRKGETAG